MKTIRSLVLIFGMICTLTLHAAAYPIYPADAFRSTSSMTSSGSSLPSAAQTGVFVTASSPGTYSPATPMYSPRRSVENPFGDDNVGSTENPLEPGTPLGDIIPPMILFALLYAHLYSRFTRQKKRP